MEHLNVAREGDEKETYIYWAASNPYARLFVIPVIDQCKKQVDSVEDRPQIV
jgi:hypothetical protein